MIFASKTAESMNTDPTPVFRPSDGKRGDWLMYPNLAPGERGPFGAVEKLIVDPRPEFTPQTKHAANPVLVAFREDTPPYAAGWLASLDPAYIRPTFGRSADNWTAEHIDHARRVLARLVEVAA